MPRDLPVSNGHLLVTFDSTYALSDIYFPHVGTENHAYRRHSRLGVWVDGKFAWLRDQGWDLSLRYADDSLVTKVTAESRDLGVALTIEDAVDFDQNVLLRRFTALSLAGHPVDVRLYLHLDIALGGNTVGDTVFYHPEYQSIVAYKNQHYLLLGGRTDGQDHLSSWTTGQKQSWRDAEDGALDNLPIAFGSVDCVGELRLGQVQTQESSVAHAWIAAGASLDEVGNLSKTVLTRGPDNLIERTHKYWQAWVTKDVELHSGLSELPEPIQKLYRRSLLIANAHTDFGGAIIASSDSEISDAFSPHGASGPPITDIFQGHENYAYSWPRDGSLVAMALDNAGYASVARAYITFCKETAVHRNKDGEEQTYMLQKYLSSGAVASNVIAWIDDAGAARLPIQEDETALVLIAIRNHYAQTGDWGFVSPLYHPMIVSMANFLVDFRNAETGLPSPSQDLWEERQGMHAFSIATTWRALRDAAYFTELFVEPDRTNKYLQAAANLKAATERHLFDPELGRFARSLTVDQDGELRRDMVVDASVFALSYFGMFDPNDPRIVVTMDAVKETLTVPGRHNGLARFEGDRYHLRQTGADMNVPGNPWFICSLWLAQYQLQCAKVEADLDAPMEILCEVERSALPSGVLAEQIDAVSGEPAGATPLTWSHATVILTVLEYLKAKERIRGSN
jgi:GH15 family glucan-1,4-alpha-glucosidase